MKKKLFIMGVVMSLCLVVSGCSLFGKDDSGKSSGTDGVEVKNTETGGLYYKINGTEVQATEYTLGDINYQGPDTTCVVRGTDNMANAFASAADKQVMVVWMGTENAGKVSDITVDFSDKIQDAISADCGLKVAGMTFDLEAVEADSNQNIENQKFTGSVKGYTEGDEEKELNAVAYTFVANGKPGCVIGIVTDAKQEQTYKDEISHNAKVLMNTIVTK